MTLKQELLELSIILFDLDHALTSLEAEAKKKNAFERIRKPSRKGRRMESDRTINWTCILEGSFTAPSNMPDNDIRDLIYNAIKSNAFLTMDITFDEE